MSGGEHLGAVRCHILLFQREWRPGQGEGLQPRASVWQATLQRSGTHKHDACRSVSKRRRTDEVPVTRSPYTRLEHDFAGSVKVAHQAPASWSSPAGALLERCPDSLSVPPRIRTRWPVRMLT
jgi:hypothetical protein